MPRRSRRARREDGSARAAILSYRCSSGPGCSSRGWRRSSASVPKARGARLPRGRGSARAGEVRRHGRRRGTGGPVPRRRERRPVGLWVRSVRPGGEVGARPHDHRRGAGCRRALAACGTEAARAPRRSAGTAGLRARGAPEEGGTGLREATPADLELLVPACAAAHEDEIGVDPLVSDPDGFPLADAVADRRRTLLALVGERHDPLQGGGVRLDSSYRPAPAGVGRPRGPRARFAQRGMRDLCRRLLAKVPRVCLFVRAEDAPAIRVYEAIGMRRTIAFRSLIF